MAGRQDVGGANGALPTAAHGAMDRNGKAGLDSSAAQRQAQYDADFTDRVIAATGPNTNPRLAQIMPSLVRHLHDFAREVDLTVAEWAAGVEMINQAGRMSDDKRNETQLLCDILGLESLVDDITSRQLQRPGSTATPSAVLGPFYRAAPPELPLGASIVQAPPEAGAAWYAEARARRTRLAGRVRAAAAAARPIAAAAVEVWEAAPNGLYEQQDPDQPEMNLRGRFVTDDDGRYAFECLRPTPYPVPADGPAGRLLHALDRHPYRPAHIHFVVTAPGFRPLVTQIFDDQDPHVQRDSVFAVKPELLVHFRDRGGDEAEGPRYELEYDFSLVEEEDRTSQ